MNRPQTFKRKRTQDQNQSFESKRICIRDDDIIVPTEILTTRFYNNS